MHLELARGLSTLQLLETSSATLEATSREAATLRAHVGHARTLLGRWARRELTDLVLLVLAFLFFFAVLFYIVQKRFLLPHAPTWHWAWSWATAGIPWSHWSPWPFATQNENDATSSSSVLGDASGAASESSRSWRRPVRPNAPEEL